MKEKLSWIWTNPLDEWYAVHRRKYIYPKVIGERLYITDTLNCITIWNTMKFQTYLGYNFRSATAH